MVVIILRQLTAAYVVHSECPESFTRLPPGIMWLLKSCLDLAKRSDSSMQPQMASGFIPEIPILTRGSLILNSVSKCSSEVTKSLEVAFQSLVGTLNVIPAKTSLSLIVQWCS